ncbi:1,2-phenylacetyl-CoA epoxidase subunit PaaE [Mangrovitalea sediminis]|uniref:1,2-phenylacetyl-CoA epoxidase subunit PaaE n=1 Tax=Mangrovitalea sediminis TaxID=1982043 RepID=UPI000BE4F0CE|nr:1,2-phenylacetyl-CoA epoxidase subunit PaaE [Mangrovitalea sediminis]
MNHFHTLTIREVQPETRDAVSIAFDVPSDLKDTFKFTQGQHLVVRAQLDGEEVRRSYSICTGVDDGELRIAIKRVPGGVFSNYAGTQLQAGDAMEVMAPSGQFFIQLDPSRQGQYLAVAAGSGITPILSIIKTTLAREPNSQFTLIYGNRATSSTMFREALEDLKNTYMGRFNLIFMFSREQQDIELYNGRIDAEKCAQLFRRWIDVPKLDAAFICGPQGMSETVRDQLKEFGLAPERIHFELFGVAGGPRRHRAETPANETGEATKVTIINDGRAIEFDLPRNTQSLLDAGKEHGADLPFSCKAGVCSTCKCKVIEGEVEMDSNFALEDYEVAAGYVLSCQSYPVSDKVVLDYDQH